MNEVVKPSDAAPGSPQEWAPPSWLRVVIVLVALIWGTAETFVLGARPASYGFILAVLFGTLGTEAVAKVRKLLQ